MMNIFINRICFFSKNKNKEASDRVYFFPKKITRLVQFIIYNLSVIILLVSCYSPTDGCLDIEATNFDASADESCDGCCTYPQLKLTTFHSIESEGILQQDTCINHSPDSLFTVDNINYFQLDDVSFYLSDFELVMPNGDVSKVLDTITLSIYEDNLTQVSKDTLVTDDFLLVKRSQFDYSIGEFRTSGTFSQLRFKIGITKRLNTTDVDTLATTHPLSSNQRMHFGDRGAGFKLLSFTIETDTSQAVEDLVDYELGQVWLNTVQIELDFPKTFEPGFDVEIPLKINYTKWLQGINFVTDTEAEISAQFVSNAAEAFEIDE